MKRLLVFSGPLTGRYPNLKPGSSAVISTSMVNGLPRILPKAPRPRPHPHRTFGEQLPSDDVTAPFRPAVQVDDVGVDLFGGTVDPDPDLDPLHQPSFLVSMARFRWACVDRAVWRRNNYPASSEPEHHSFEGQTDGHQRIAEPLAERKPEPAANRRLPTPLSPVSSNSSASAWL